MSQAIHLPLWEAANSSSKQEWPPNFGQVKQLKNPFKLHSIAGIRDLLVAGQIGHCPTNKRLLSEPTFARGRTSPVLKLALQVHQS